MSLPPLPRGAAYILLNAPARRNALSLSELRSLRDQLIKANTSPTTGRLLLLPAFKPSVLASLEQSHARLHTPASGSSLHPNSRADHARTSATQPRSPDHQEEQDYAWLTSSTHFSRAAPPCPASSFSPPPPAPSSPPATTSASSARPPPPTPPSSPKPSASAPRVGTARAWRMVALGEDWGAEELGDAVRVAKREERDAEDGEAGLVRALDREVQRTVERLLAMSPQQNAMGKRAFWTQVGIAGREAEEEEGKGSDGLEDALAWTGRVMALHAKSGDAQEGIGAFLEKRPAVWKSVEES
ncbi:hypothetical protein VTJ83DRAFT_753 [Remersonia thermophila]|uniref:Uncharacterized protein n=1 Tax=Remersonia thermophila TaxID=72144 RepID=A0ABR4DNM6_9PEZI